MAWIDWASPSPWLGDFCLLVWICGDSKEQELFRAPAWPVLFPVLLSAPPVACACPHSCLYQCLPPPLPHKRAAAESTLRRKLLVGRNLKREKQRWGKGWRRRFGGGGAAGGTCSQGGWQREAKMVALPARSWGLGRGWERAASSLTVHLNARRHMGQVLMTAFCLLAGQASSFSPGLMLSSSAPWAQPQGCSVRCQLPRHGNLCRVSLEPFSWCSVIEYFLNLHTAAKEPASCAPRGVCCGDVTGWWEGDWGHPG